LNFDATTQSLWGVSPRLEPDSMLEVHVHVYSKRTQELIGTCSVYVVAN